MSGAFRSPIARPPTSFQSWSDRVFRIVAQSFGVAVVLLLASIVVQVLRHAAPAMAQHGVGFLVRSRWDTNHDTYGVLPQIIGTLYTSLLALLLGGVLGITVALVTSQGFIGKRWELTMKNIIELLAAIPSVVYGLWGIFVLIPFLRATVFPALKGAFGFLPLFEGPIYGPSMLSASIILAIMVMPYIMSVSREVLLAVPGSQREAALALGATRWEAVVTAVVPYARTGIMGAIILGLGRALGETMAVTMLIGNRHEIAASLFAPGYTMAAAIANEFAEAATPMHFSALTYVAFTLFVVTVLVNAGARLLIWRVARGSGAGSSAL